MDAVEFIIEHNSMCLYYDGDCKKCPRYGNGCTFSRIQDEAYLKILVADVEKWSKEHPQKTRQQDFLEKFPKAETDDKGMPKFCCAKLGYTCNCLKTDCRDCWNTPLEDDE